MLNNMWVNGSKKPEDFRLDTLANSRQTSTNQSENQGDLFTSHRKVTKPAKLPMDYAGSQSL